MKEDEEDFAFRESPVVMTTQEGGVLSSTCSTCRRRSGEMKNVKRFISMLNIRMSQTPIGFPGPGCLTPGQSMRARRNK